MTRYVPYDISSSPFIDCIQFIPRTFTVALNCKNGQVIDIPHTVWVKDGYGMVKRVGYGSRSGPRVEVGSERRPTCRSTVLEVHMFCFESMAQPISFRMFLTFLLVGVHVLDDTYSASFNYLLIPCWQPRARGDMEVAQAQSMLG